MDGQDMIDLFGQAVDEMLKKETIQMVITLPEGSMDPDIASSLKEFGEGKAVMDFYILLHTLRKAVDNLMEIGIIDETKKEDVIDNLLDMVKVEIMEEASDEN